MEGPAGDKGNLAFDRALEQLPAVHPFRQGNPQEQPTLGMCPADARGHCLFHDLQHYIPPRVVRLADELDMLVKETTVADLVGQDLVESGGVQVGTLFCLGQLADHFWRGDNPGQPQARGQQFRKSA